MGAAGSQREGETGRNEARDRQWKKAKEESEENPNPRGRIQVSPERRSTAAGHLWLLSQLLSKAVPQVLRPAVC